MRRLTSITLTSITLPYLSVTKVFVVWTCLELVFLNSVSVTPLLCFSFDRWQAFITTFYFMRFCICQYSCILFSCRCKLEMSFEIKKQNIFNASLMAKGFVFLINIVCSAFDVFRGGWVGWEENVKMTFCVAM